MTPEERASVLEEAAKVCDAARERYIAEARAAPPDKVLLGHRQLVADYLAAAIRALKPMVQEKDTMAGQDQDHAEMERGAANSGSTLPPDATPLSLPTPRTDAVCAGHHDGTREFGLMMLAQELERALSALQKQNEELKHQCEELKKELEKHGRGKCQPIGLPEGWVRV